MPDWRFWRKPSDTPQSADGSVPRAPAQPDKNVGDDARSRLGTAGDRSGGQPGSWADARRAAHQISDKGERVEALEQVARGAANAKRPEVAARAVEDLARLDPDAANAARTMLAEHPHLNAADQRRAAASITDPEQKVRALQGVATRAAEAGSTEVASRIATDIEGLNPEAANAIHAALAHNDRLTAADQRQHANRITDTYWRVRELRGVATRAARADRLNVVDSVAEDLAELDPRAATAVSALLRERLDRTPD